MPAFWCDNIENIAGITYIHSIYGKKRPVRTVARTVRINYSGQGRTRYGQGTFWAGWRVFFGAVGEVMAAFLLFAAYLGRWRY